MKRKINNPARAGKGADRAKPDPDPVGYPYYQANEDIYAKDKEEIDLDPEDPAKIKSTSETGRKKLNEKDFQEARSGSDLDIPGAELDDEEENIGSEDEENNHYSLGGDNHNDLEENRSEDEVDG